MSPLITVWRHPRATMRVYARTLNVGYRVLVPYLYGVEYSFERMLSRSNNRVSLAALIVVAAIAGGGGGLVMLYLHALAIDMTGSWFGGRGTLKEIQNALICGRIPIALSLIIWLLLFARF